ncbi:MAG: type IX secretion system outer membrane channel protein PorV [Bacteroidales bacterium]|nr:type IX secretion system outer membrane channel protein PorV [Bacteroidales bacterium]
MVKKTVAVLIFLAAIGGNPELFSQSTGEINAVQTVVPFLTIAPDSRAGGMGDAGVATSPDVFSMHWNPAKFAFIDGNSGVGISYSPWLRNLGISDINIAYLAGYKRLDTKQVLSVSLLYSSLGKVPLTDEFGNPIRTINPNEFALDAAYSRLFTDNLSGGIAFRFIYSNLTSGSYSGGDETKPGTSFAADISGYYQKDITLFSKDAQLGFGLNFSNIGSKMSYKPHSQTSDFIPMNMRLGTAVTIDLDSYNKITATIDINKLLVPTTPIYFNIGDINERGDTIRSALTEIKAGKDPNVAVPVAIFQSFFDAPGGVKEELREFTVSYGVEYWYNDQFAIRGGYFQENETKGNRKYFTAGAGFRLKIFTIDFSYLMPLAQNHPLAHTLRFSLAFDFNALRNASRSQG